MKLCNIIDIQYKLSDRFSEYEGINVNTPNLGCLVTPMVINKICGIEF